MSKLYIDAALISAVEYWYENAEENMAVPFIVSIATFYDRTYTLEGTNVYTGELLLCCRYYDMAEDATKFRILDELPDFTDETFWEAVESIITKHLEEYEVQE